MSPLGLLHTGLGVAGLVLGTAVLFSPKGTRRHVLAGRSYVIAIWETSVPVPCLFCGEWWNVGKGLSNFFDEVFSIG